MMSWLQPFCACPLVADPAPPAAPAPEPSSFIPHPSSLPVPPSSDRPACSTAPASTVEPPGPAESTPQTPCAVQGAGDQGPGTREKYRGPRRRRSRSARWSTPWVPADCEARPAWCGWGYGRHLDRRAAPRLRLPRRGGRRIVDRLKAEGIRGEMLRVNRIVAISWVARLFGYRQAKLLPVSTLRALLPLIKRHPRTGQWEIRSGVAGRARRSGLGIGARPTVAAVREAVEKDLRAAGGRPRRRAAAGPSPDPPPPGRSHIDDLAFIASAARRSSAPSVRKTGPP